MEILEIKPLKNKKIKLYLIRDDNKRITHFDHNHLRDILEQESFRFAVIDLNDKELKKSYSYPLMDFLDKNKIPYYSVDIPSSVKDYLYVEILENEAQINELEMEYENLITDSKEIDSFKAQNLKSWIDLLKNEVVSKKRFLEATVKPRWILKQILDIAKNINNDKFSIMHFTHGELYSELKRLFEQYNIKVIKYDINKINIKTILV